LVSLAPQAAPAVNRLRANISRTTVFAFIGFLLSRVGSS
jgi:hypothetical protein